MRLLRLNEVETNSADRVYRYSRLLAGITVLVTLAIAARVLLSAVTGNWKPGYYIAGVILAFMWLMRRFITARFRPSNWLARVNDQGVFIQFRSYLNYHLPQEDLTVVFISFGEIRSARLIKERVTTLDLPGQGTQTSFLRYVELELAGDIAALSAALDVELTEKAPKEKRWYGTSSTLYEDHPARMESPPFLRIHWQVFPGTHKFLDALRPYTTIAEPVSLNQDFSHLQSLSPNEQQQRLRELAVRGQTVAAIYTARKLFRCSLVEAQEIVEGQTNKTSAGA